LQDLQPFVLLVYDLLCDFFWYPLEPSVSMSDMVGGCKSLKYKADKLDKSQIDEKSEAVLDR